MNWTRFLRAQEAAAIEAVEQRRRRYLAGEAIELDEDDWRMIAMHDALMGAPAGTRDEPESA